LRKATNLLLGEIFEITPPTLSSVNFRRNFVEASGRNREKRRCCCVDTSCKRDADKCCSSTYR